MSLSNTVNNINGFNDGGAKSKEKCKWCKNSMRAGAWKCGSCHAERRLEGKGIIGRSIEILLKFLQSIGLALLIIGLIILPFQVLSLYLNDIKIHSTIKKIMIFGNYCDFIGLSLLFITVILIRLLPKIPRYYS